MLSTAIIIITCMMICGDICACDVDVKFNGFLLPVDEKENPDESK
jgi:hypothetical protein